MRAWESFLEKQREKLGSQIVKKWLAPIKVVKFDAGNIYLEAQDHFQALWFEEHVRENAENELFSNNQRKIKVHLSIANAYSHKKTGKRQTAKKPKQTAQPDPFKFDFDDLDPFCTYENFIPTEANLVPYKLMNEIINFQTQNISEDFSDKELITFNPVYLYGLGGTGKTHLLMATTQALRDKGLNAIYVRAETFTDHVVKAIRAGEMSTFRQTYRQADVLIVDDVHIFSRKGATQEEFFHTFNTLHLAGKQIILTANCVPQDLRHIEPRLISRFEWGIVLPMTPLDRADLKKLLSKKMEAINFPLNKKSAEFLLDTFNANPKSMARALDALVLRTHMKSDEPVDPEKISIPLIEKALEDLIEEEKQGELTPEKILITVAEHFGVTSDDLTGNSQRKESVLPRQVAMYLCRSKLNLPYMKIGQLFDRDHSTVMSSIKKIEGELESQGQDLAASLNSIKNKLLS